MAVGQLQGGLATSKRPKEWPGTKSAARLGSIRPSSSGAAIVFPPRPAGFPFRYCQNLVALLGLVVALFALVGDGSAQPTAAGMIEHMDADGDGRISQDEFRGRKRPFTDFDQDGDGYATRAEIEAAFGARGGKSSEGAAGQQGGQGVSASLPGGATLRDLDEVTRDAFLAQRVRAHEIERGLIESRLIPSYPSDASCPHIDHIFGEPWEGPVYLRKSNATRHHGADIPAWRGTPVLAMADGVVIAKNAGEGGDFRGLQVTLRHSPEETGLPIWLYTNYAHFSEMPELQIGQQVRMGEPLGPTGKTGVKSSSREDHLHVEVLYSTSDRYVATRHGIIPVDGHYADVVALMRARMPLDTNAMRALPDAERRVTIPHRLTRGVTVPADARIIWPYACE
jgi:murein DD-endopeptidase MepM/ murein hydrolase activator NlpD